MSLHAQFGSLREGKVDLLRMPLCGWPSSAERRPQEPSRNRRPDGHFVPKSPAVHLPSHPLMLSAEQSSVESSGSAILTEEVFRSRRGKFRRGTLHSVSGKFVRDPLAAVRTLTVATPASACPGDESSRRKRGRPRKVVPPPLTEAQGLHNLELPPDDHTADCSDHEVPGLTPPTGKLKYRIIVEVYE